MAKKQKVHRISKEERERYEKQRAELKNFQDMWFTYLTMFRGAYYGSLEITREEEDKFLRLKCQLARRHEYLIYWLDKEYIVMEPITKLLQDTMTLRRVSEYKRNFYTKIEAAWHRTVLSLARTAGHYRLILDESIR